MVRRSVAGPAPAPTPALYQRARYPGEPDEGDYRIAFPGGILVPYRNDNGGCEDVWRVETADPSAVRAICSAGFVRIRGDDPGPEMEDDDARPVPREDPRQPWTGLPLRGAGPVPEEECRFIGEALCQLRRDLPLDPAMLAEAARKRAEESRELPLSVAVVVTFTGWDREREGAAASAIEETEQAGGRVILVQNDPAAHALVQAFQARQRRASPLVELDENRGFAAACNRGWRGAPSGASWILFTQSDATWTAGDLRRAVALAEVVSEAEEGYPPILGPSGGGLAEDRPDQLWEWGRNVEPVAHAPRGLDWVAGFWLLAHRTVLERVGGWDEGFFLYYEDPDLCLRAAAECGCRCIVWPELRVSHARGTTIRPLLGNRGRLYAQQASRDRFKSRWRPTDPLAIPPAR